PTRESAPDRSELRGLEHARGQRQWLGSALKLVERPVLPVPSAGSCRHLCRRGPTLDRWSGCPPQASRRSVRCGVDPCSRRTTATHLARRCVFPTWTARARLYL